ncbi:hypothetical protein [Haladaptatus salinisoli]|uniref:hypothetical protein n=1 Tax=Haladaptatus salinisoli TaxID=2884876 RepID=UPI001D0B7F48|nr:hypothetical protein [Haladaptatus salinisoli]
MTRKRTVAAVALGAYLLANLAHGVPHAAVPVPLTPFQSAFVAAVTLAPIVGFVLLLRGSERLGSAVFVVSMAASLAFGVYFHFLVPNPDSVRAVSGPWSGPFFLTAALVAAAGAAGVVAGAWPLNGERSESPEARRR